MNYLTQAAASDYVSLLRYCLYYGLIGPETFLERLTTLRFLAKPDTAEWSYASQLMKIEELDFDQFEEDGSVAISNIQDGTSKKPTEIVVNDPDEGPLVVRFMPSASTGLADWEFHKGDADPYPTVPHGHRGREKLDAYRGFVTRNGKQVGRVGRIAIVRLWNERAFRSFAREAIDHFIDSSPHLQVKRRMPGIRRGRAFR